LYFNVSITSRELQTSRLGLVSAGEANVSARAFTSRAHPCRLQIGLHGVFKNGTLYNCRQTQCVMQNRLQVYLSTHSRYAFNQMSASSWRLTQTSRKPPSELCVNLMSAYVCPSTSHPLLVRHTNSPKRSTATAFVSRDTETAHH